MLVSSGECPDRVEHRQRALELLGDALTITDRARGQIVDGIDRGASQKRIPGEFGQDQPLTRSLSREVARDPLQMSPGYVDMDAVGTRNVRAAGLQAASEAPDHAPRSGE